MRYPNIDFCKEIENLGLVLESKTNNCGGFDLFSSFLLLGFLLLWLDDTPFIFFYLVLFRSNHVTLFVLELVTSSYVSLFLTFFFNFGFFDLRKERLTVTNEVIAEADLIFPWVLQSLSFLFISFLLFSLILYPPFLLTFKSSLDLLHFLNSSNFMLLFPVIVPFFINSSINVLFLLKEFLFLSDEFVFLGLDFWFGIFLLVFLFLDFLTDVFCIKLNISIDDLKFLIKFRTFLSIHTSFITDLFNFILNLLKRFSKWKGFLQFLNQFNDTLFFG